MKVVLKPTGWMNTANVVRWAHNGYRFGTRRNRANMRDIIISMFPVEHATTGKRVADVIFSASTSELEAMIKGEAVIVEI